MKKKEWVSQYVADLAAVTSSSPAPLANREAVLEQLPRMWAAVDQTLFNYEKSREQLINTWEQAIDSIMILEEYMPELEEYDRNTFMGNLGAMREIAASCIAIASQLPTVAKHETNAMYRSVSRFLPLLGGAVDIFVGANTDLGVGAYEYYSSLLPHYESNSQVVMPSDMLGGVVSDETDSWVLAPDPSVVEELPRTRLPFPECTPPSWSIVKPSPSSGGGGGKRHIQPGEVLYIDVFPDSSSPSAYVTFCDGYAIEEYYSVDNGERTGFKLLLSSRMSFFNTFAPSPIYNYYVISEHLPLVEYARIGFRALGKPLFPVYRQIMPAVGFNHYSVSEANYIFYCNEILQYEWKHYADGVLFREFKDCKQYDEFFSRFPLTVSVSPLSENERIEGRTVIKYPTFTHMILDSFPSESTEIRFPPVPASSLPLSLGLSRCRDMLKPQNVKSLIIR